MQRLELESPGLEELEKLEDYSRKRLGGQVIGGEPVDPDMSVDLYILGLNRREKASNVNRLAPHIQDPYLLVSFKDVEDEEYSRMSQGFRREEATAFRDLQERFDDTLGDYGVYLEEYYAAISEGELDSKLFHVPAEISGLQQSIEAAESLDRAMRKDPDYDVEAVRLIGGVERSGVEEALRDVQPAIVFEIGYSGDEDALEAYNKHLEIATPREADADTVPGFVYVGRESYPEVVFNGPPYENLCDGELEKRLWEEMEDI